MHNFEHKKLIEELMQLDVVPKGAEEYGTWISAPKHLTFVQANALSDEVVVFASSEYTFIHSLVVQNSRLSPLDHEDLLRWSSNPWDSIASYVYGGGKEGVWLERGLSSTGAKTLEGATPLVLGRRFEGWEGSGRNYFEVNQEYTHVTGIHWRPEKRAFCRFDRHGDIEAVVSITNRDEKDGLSLVTFRWGPLQQYLAATDSTLVRMFDFTLLRRGHFDSWPDSSEERHADLASGLYYRQKVDPTKAGYTRGFQLVGLRGAAIAIQKSIIEARRGGDDEAHVDFVAYDWRHQQIRKISTDPAATTNYFEAKNNDLPFELSPVFFRPEVLLKYKADRDKYTLEERNLRCRSAWSLRGIDVNEAGQVHAYICDLRQLPYTEQLHWLSYNETPKVGISKRALTTDFKGEFTDFSSPLQEAKTILRTWIDVKTTVWQIRDERLLDRVSKPLTSSRDEWAESFMDLAKLVVEGFLVETLRSELATAGVSYSKDERSLGLLEKVLKQRTGSDDKLEGLRTIQSLRSKLKGHAGGSEAEALSEQALTKFESYGGHFDHVCSLLVRDLQIIDHVLVRANRPA